MLKLFVLLISGWIFVYFAAARNDLLICPPDISSPCYCNSGFEDDLELCAEWESKKVKLENITKDGCTRPDWSSVTCKIQSINDSRTFLEDYVNLLKNQYMSTFFVYVNSSIKFQNDTFKGIAMDHLEIEAESEEPFIEFEPEVFSSIQNNLSTTLKLKLNKKSEIPLSIIQNLTELKGLNLNDNLIRNLTANLFSNMKKLQRIEFQNCQIEYIDPLAFAQVKKLRFLQLTGNKFREIPFGLGFLRLDTLLLFRGSIESVKDEDFNGLCDLKTLGLHSKDVKITNLSSTAFKMLRKLEFLHLYDIAAGAFQPDIFSTMTELRHLTISDSSLNDIPGDFSNVTKLTHLVLDTNAISEIPPNSLPVSLETLNLDDNKIVKLPKASLEPWLSTIGTGIKKEYRISLYGNPLDCDCGELSWIEGVSFKSGVEISGKCWSKAHNQTYWLTKAPFSLLEKTCVDTSLNSSSETK